MLSETIADDAIYISDVGNHCFLAAEHFTVKKPGTFIAPSDFNCMGYSIPAAIGVKFAHPAQEVIAVCGDGCFLMSGLEILTAAANHKGVVYFVFHDGELAQISQTQSIPYNRKTCTVVPDYNVFGIAQATGAAFIEMADNSSISEVIRQALYLSSKGQPVIVDVQVDYSKKTTYTKGVVKTNSKRFPLNDLIRIAGRIVTRKITG